MTVVVFTFQNPDTPGINGWHWEVAITYTDILADICLHGNCAEIQKMALMGVNKDIADPFKRGFTSVPLPSAGLLDLAFFRALHETKDGGNYKISLFVLNCCLLFTCAAHIQSHSSLLLSVEVNTMSE